MSSEGDLTHVCNFSYPESQGDALLVEVQDAKKSVQGRTTIPVSSLTDNPVRILPSSSISHIVIEVILHNPYGICCGCLTMQSDRIRWWPIYHEDQECVGKIQLFIGSTITNNETNHIKVSCPSAQLI